MRFKGPIISLSILAAMFIYYAWKHPSPVKDFMNPQIQRFYDRTESIDIRENDATAIRMTMGKEAIDILLPILLDRSESSELRCTVAYELKEIKDPRVEEIFKKMKQQNVAMEQCDEKLEITASTQSMNKQHDPLVWQISKMEFPNSYIQDKNPEIRQAACERLGSTKNYEAIKFLVAALNDKNKSVRHAAVRGLIKIRHPEVVRQLIALLKNENSPAADLAHLALLELTGTGIPKNYALWEKWLEENNQSLDFYLNVNSKNAFPE
jgi:HEAT repeat protein